MRWLQGLDPLATQIGQQTWFSPYQREKIRLLLVCLLLTVVTNQDYMPLKSHIVFYLHVSCLVTNLDMFPSIRRVLRHSQTCICSEVRKFGVSRSGHELTVPHACRVDEKLEREGTRRKG